MKYKNQRIRAVSIIVFLILFSSLLTGCWSARELNESALVAGVGFDKDGDQYKMTVQILQPLKLTPNARTKSSNATYITSETGQSIFGIIRTFPHKTARKLFWSHAHVFVIGRDLAQQSVTETLDWFYRNQELRPLSYVVLSATSAADVLESKTELNPIGAYGVANIVSVLTDTSDAPRVDLMDFMALSASPVHAAYMPELNQLEVIGTGVFLHDRLVGELSLAESKGLTSLIGKVGGGHMTIPSLTNPSQHMAVEIIHGGAKRSVQLIHGEPAVLYQLNYVVDIAEDPNLFPHDTQTFNEIEHRVEMLVQQDAMQCIAKVKSYHADVIGTGEAIELRYPQIWKRLEKNWTDEFPRVPISVDVTVHLRHEGIIQGSI